MVRPCPGGARLSALGFCITLLAFSVFWQLRLARVMERGIPYQKHHCNIPLYFICYGHLSQFCGCWLIFGHWLWNLQTLIINLQMPGSLTSLTTEAQTSRIPTWKIWKQSLHLLEREEEYNSDDLLQTLISENHFHVVLSPQTHYCFTAYCILHVTHCKRLFMKTN